MYRSLYFSYGIIIALLGIVGYLLTHAKSALISGLASAAVLILVSFFVEKLAIMQLIGKVVNVMLLGVFSWRASLAITALLHEHPEKLVPAILLALMALVSLVVFLLSFKKQ